MIYNDSSCQAEFEDGYILDETKTNDVSPNDPHHNIFRDILEKWSEPAHGKMVRFTVFYKDNKYDIDWRGVPDNARPIRYRLRSNSINEVMQANGKCVQAGEPVEHLDGVGFGYQYTDENGENVKEVKEVF